MAQRRSQRLVIRRSQVQFPRSAYQSATDVLVGTSLYELLQVALDRSVSYMP